MTTKPRTWVALRVLREKDGHSLSSLARTAEMSLGYLSDLENGKRNPSPAITKKLATALNVTLSMLEKDRRYEEAS